VASNDYLLYMNIQEQINLVLKERFEAEDISFAYPTQTIFMEGNPVTVGHSPGTSGPVA